MLMTRAGKETVVMTIENMWDWMELFDNGLDNEIRFEIDGDNLESFCPNWESYIDQDNPFDSLRVEDAKQIKSLHILLTEKLADLDGEGFYDVVDCKFDLVKEYIEGPTIFDLVRDGASVEPYMDQVRHMADQAKAAGLNIDYFPTNFVVRDGLIYYVDYECNAYMEAWNFENWGVKYWSRTEEFEAYLKDHGLDSRVEIKEERLYAREYVEFLKRTDLGSQYPRERFQERIEKLVRSVSISLAARNEQGLLVGVLFGLTDYAYWLYVTDLGVDRAYERRGIGKRLMKTAHEIAGGEKDIAVYLIANENAVLFYEKLGMRKAEDVMQYNHVEWSEFTVT